MADSAGSPTADAARAHFARAALGLTPHSADARVGPLVLHPHQRHAAARLRYALRHYGVALLADDVGLGKTAVAAALLRDVRDALVVAPAALRPHWTAALHAAALDARVVATEALGRATAPATDRRPAFIVVDEAHHFRNPRTRRWRQLAALAAHARLLLLSATPVHNRPDDLAAIFALTLGARASALDAPTLARLVVRRAAADVDTPRHGAAHAPDPPSTRPTVAPTVWLDVADAPAVLAAIHAVPTIVAPADGAARPDLDRHTLVRLWASSDAALRAGIRRRRARALALGDALDAGHAPSRADLTAVARSVDADPSAVQLTLLPSSGSPAVCDATADRARVDAYLAALARVGRLLSATEAEDRDVRRVALLRAVRARHPTARVVAFSHSIDTVRALYRALAPDGRVAMLTAGGGRIASGPVPRGGVLARFAPLGQHQRPPSPIERITVLLTTDALAEGLDLRDASVVVHLDLPWTPARIAQRTGRAVRPGAPNPTVYVYAFRPPASAAADLRLAAHARAKHRAARLTVGSTALERAVTLDATADDAPRLLEAAAAHLARDRLLERWTRCADVAPRATAGVAVRCGASGYVAVVALPTCLGAIPVPTVVAALGDRGPTRAPAVVRRALAALDRATAVVWASEEGTRAVRRQLARWAHRRVAHTAVASAASVLQPRPPRANDSRRDLLARADRALATAPPHERARLAVASALLHATLARPIPADRECAIRSAAPVTAPDAVWLLAAAAAAEDASPDTRPASTGRPALRALVLLVH